MPGQIKSWADILQIWQLCLAIADFSNLILLVILRSQIYMQSHFCEKYLEQQFSAALLVSVW